MDIARLEQDLRSYRPEGMTGLPPNFVWPRYEGFSVANLAATIAQALGVPFPEALPPLQPALLGDLLEGVERVVLVVLDALGWEQLQAVLTRFPENGLARLARRGRLLPLTTTFLSTTNSVLNTIWTGRSSFEHGLLAYTLYLREWLMAVEAISFSMVNAPFAGLLEQWGFDGEEFIPVPTLAQRLQTANVPMYAVTARPIMGSALSKMQYRGVAQVYGYGFASEFWLMLARVLREHRGKRFVVGGYWSGVDNLAHSYGPQDRTGELEIRAIGYLLEAGFWEELRAEERRGTLLLVTADHGQIASPAEAAILLQDHPVLQEALFMAPLGEQRVPFFYVRPGQYKRVWEYLHAHLATQFIFFSRQALLQSGLLGLGKPHPELRYRLGDIIGIARNEAFLVREPSLIYKLRGRHGGLDASEMLVPLFAARLDA